VTDLLAESYAPERNRIDAYHHMAARVVEAALDHPPVTFLMQGHPFVFAYAPALIVDLAALLGLRVRLLPAISSMDALFAEMRIDPATSGLLMYEATDLLLRRRPLLPDVPTLVWQVGTLETRLHSTRASRPERLERFVAHLLTAYRPEHVVRAVHISPHPLAPTTVVSVPIGELASCAPSLHPGVTLYIPPSVVRPIADFDLLQKLDDPAHLDRITHHDGLP
jgi:hypothetical protein